MEVVKLVTWHTTALPTHTQCQQLELHPSRTPAKMIYEHDQPELMAEIIAVIAIAVAAPVILFTMLAAAIAIYIYYKHFYKDKNDNVVINATQDDQIIVLPGSSQDIPAEVKQTRASKDLSLKSILHSGQTDGLDWTRKLEDSKLTALETAGYQL